MFRPLGTYLVLNDNPFCIASQGLSMHSVELLFFNKLCYDGNGNMKLTG